MASTATLSQLRDRARQRADHKNDQYVTDSELDALINESLADLYDQLVIACEDYLTSPTPFTITILANQQQYDLPSDFYKARGVELQVNNATNSWVTLDRFNWNERNKFNWSPQPWNVLGASQIKYHLLNGKITFIPYPQSGAGVIRLWYIPAMTKLSSGTDTFDFINGWDAWVVADVARKIKDTEESDTTSLDQFLKRQYERIVKMASWRDAERPSKTTDINDDGTWSGAFGATRY